MVWSQHSILNIVIHGAQTPKYKNCLCCSSARILSWSQFDINPNIVLDQKHVWPWARFNAMQHDSYRWDFALVEVMMVVLGRDDRGKGCDINHNNSSQIKKQQQPQVRNVPRLDWLSDPSKEGAGQLHCQQQQHHVVQMSQAVQEATRVDSLLIENPKPTCLWKWGLSLTH